MPLGAEGVEQFFLAFRGRRGADGVGEAEHGAGSGKVLRFRIGHELRQRGVCLVKLGVYVLEALLRLVFFIPQGLELVREFKHPFGIVQCDHLLYMNGLLPLR